MVEAGTKKTLALMVFLVLACSLVLFAISAIAIPYTHSEEEADAGSGVIHIAVTLDSTAIGGSVQAAWLPVNSDDATVTAVMNEYMTASENKVDRFAHEDYNMQSMADYLSGKEYEVAVYKAGEQQPGAEAVYTSTSVGGADYSDLGNGDGVYVTVTK